LKFDFQGRKKGNVKTDFIDFIIYTGGVQFEYGGANTERNDRCAKFGIDENQSPERSNAR
jgi:hypothetical protein